jgi:hypothetical protein|tara:strand:+ start:1107 stop:1655 length:549 start_codon:yes stop_codon:yes gene_type:complete
MKKNFIKAATTVALLASLGACSSYTTIAERDEYAQPKWYANCVESGYEGWFWMKEEFAYACGAGESVFVQAAEEQMYAIAMNNFAKRMNSSVNSKTELAFQDNNGKESRQTTTNISYVVKDTTIREHIAKETGTFKYQGKMYTFVKLRMSKDIFDALVQEAKTTKVTANRSSTQQDIIRATN